MNTETASTTCLSCGATVNDRYCGACGEKVLQENEKSVTHFLGEALHNITHADGKFFRSVRCLIMRPGTLSVNYLSGKRKQFMAPLSLFVFVNLLYLLLSPVDALNSNYYSQRGQAHAQLAVKKFEDKMKTSGWDEVRLSERYNAKSGKLAKLLVFLLVLSFSIPLALVYFKRDRYYVDHLIFATEVINFMVLVFLLILPWLLNFIFYWLQHLFGINAYFNPNHDISVVILVLGIVSYLIVSTHTMYRNNWWLTILKAVALFIGFCFCVVLYRFILFSATMAML